MNIRRARREDVPSIISIYSLDSLTGHREIVTDPLPRFYYDAFDRIDSDSNQILLVADIENEVVASLQMTYIQHLISRAFRRAVIEAIFVHPQYHGSGIGSALIRSAIGHATSARCVAIELTSNKLRRKAHGFYQKMGFASSHEGFKLSLGKAEQIGTANPHACGTFGTSTAEQPLVPKASGDT